LLISNARSPAAGANLAGCYLAIFVRRRRYGTDRSGAHRFRGPRLTIAKSGLELRHLFSGASKELGRQMKLGIEIAFNRVNDAGGVEADAQADRRRRCLYPGAHRRGHEAALREGPGLGVIGNVGTSTAAVAVPYALERRMLFFGGFTGANVIRNDPPDRYVFNYRASYHERPTRPYAILSKCAGYYPDSRRFRAPAGSRRRRGVRGCRKAFRSSAFSDAGILRLEYKRNTVDVDDAVNLLKAQKVPSRRWS